MFQSTRPRGARRFQKGHVPFNKGFNPRARVGRDLDCASMTFHQRCFNPRARVGRDPRPPRPGCCFFCFNPRARVGRDA